MGMLTVRQENTTTSCTDYVDVFTGSGYTCQNILDQYNITIADFFAWNPSVGSDCSTLFIGYQYCVAGPTASGSPTTTTSPPTTTTTGPGAPTQTGQPANCNKWYIAKCTSSHPSSAVTPTNPLPL